MKVQALIVYLYFSEHSLSKLQNNAIFIYFILYILSYVLQISFDHVIWQALFGMRN